MKAKRKYELINYCKKVDENWFNELVIDTEQESIYNPKLNSSFDDIYDILYINILMDDSIINYNLAIYYYNKLNKTNVRY